MKNPHARRKFGAHRLLPFLIICSLVSPSPAQERSPSIGKITYKPATVTAPRAARVEGSLVASSGKAVLLVVTRPERSQVLVNGQPKGVSNGDGVYREEVAVGKEYKISVRAEKYQPYEESVTAPNSNPLVVIAQMTPNFGSFRLLNIPKNAGISLDAQKLNYQFQQGTNEVVLPEVPLGEHQIRIDHPDFVEWDRTVDAVPGFEISIAPQLLPAARIALTSLAGVEVVIDSVKQGVTDAGGKLAVRTPLQPGKHEMSLSKTGYVTTTRPINIARGDNNLTFPELEPIPSYADFADFFKDGLGQWEAPKAWQWSKGQEAMAVLGLGMGFVKNRSYRDFDLAFNLKFTNNAGAAWVIRAKDARNYYLFVLSVKDRLLRTFVVEDGKMMAREPSNILVDPGANTSYQIRAFVQGDRIRHSIKNQATGDEELMGVLVDGRFRYGSVGLTTVSGEQFLVEDFFVRPYPESK